MNRLVKLRMQGYAPSLAYIWFGLQAAVPDWHRAGTAPEIEIPADANIRRLDLRAFNGLSVIALTETYTDPFYRLLGRLRGVTDGITGYVFDWRDEDMGFYLIGDEIKTLRDHLEGK